MTTTILVTGATGTVGSELVRALADRPEMEIRAAVRALPGKLASERATPVELDAIGKAGRTARVSSAVADLLGRPAISFATFARDHAATWRTR